MITVTCKSFRVRHTDESIILEVEAAEPANLVPQLLTKTEVALRLAISERKVETLAASGRLPSLHIDSCLRFRETDVLQFLAESQEAAPRAVISSLA